MTTMTNSEVQLKLSLGLEKIEAFPDSIEKDLAHAIVAIVKAYSASGNSIPGLRGKGLEEVLGFLDSLDETGITARSFSFKHLGKSLISDTYEH